MRPGALVLHGLTGSPHSVAGMAAALVAAGFDVEMPLLPGHGTSAEDLAGCGWDDWSAAAEAAYRRVAARSGPVVAVGLSMGGALAAGVAADHPEVAGLAVVNPLVDPPAADFLDVLERFLAAGEQFLPGLAGDVADPDAAEEAYDRLPVAALLSLGRGLDALRPHLVDVACPVLILTSRHDHVVPAVSSDVLAAAVSGPVERVWLEQSQHVATLDLDRADLERRVMAFARRAAGSELGDAAEREEQAGGDDARRGQQRERSGY
ncbi:MAG: alpha/beta hydrolase [Acidimicrobiales bacterium]